MNVNLLRLPGTASLTGCALPRAQPVFRQQLAIIQGISSPSLCRDEKYSGNGLESRTTRHRQRSCQAAAIAGWASAPLPWLRNQFSKEIWVQITSSLCAVTAFVVCMLLSVMVTATVCILRFHMRERKRAMAIARRKEEGIQWFRYKVRRALVLAQDISDFRLADKYISAREAAMEGSRDRLMATHHARSLACTASPAARNTRHISGRMMCASFRDVVPDNWRMIATGKALGKEVQDQPLIASPAQDASTEPVEVQAADVDIPRQDLIWSPQSPLEQFDRVNRMRKLAGSETREQWLAEEVA